jgi:hypothetical protein
MTKLSHKYVIDFINKHSLSIDNPYNNRFWDEILTNKYYRELNASCIIEETLTVDKDLLHLWLYYNPEYEANDFAWVQERTEYEDMLKDKIIIELIKNAKVFFQKDEK